MHCVRAGQFMTGPPHTTDDCKLGGWGARLSVSVCSNYQQALSAAVNAVLAYTFRKSIMEKRKRERE